MQPRRSDPVDPNKTPDLSAETLPGFRRKITPRGLVLLLAIWIFLAEIADMLVLHTLPPMPPLAKAVIDATFLLVILSPGYILLYRPLMRNWEQIKRMDQALRTSEERYRTLVEDMDFGISLMDAEHNILMANRALGRFYQRPPEDFLGRKCFKEFAGQDHLCPRCPGEVAMKTKQPAVLEGERRRMDGSLWHAHIHAFPVLDENGDAKGFIEVTEDVTEQKRMEKKLREKEERLAMALEAANDGIWDWDVPSGKVYFSPRWSAMLGYRPEEIAPYYVSWENLLHPEDRAQVLGSLNRHLEGLSPVYEAEVRMKAKSGAWVWILTRGKIVERDADGKPVRLVGTHTDVTERKRAEENARLLARQLLNATEEERKRLARDLHDEFGQILTAIQLGMETLKNSFPGMQTKQIKQFARLMGLVDQLGDHVRDVSAQLRPTMLDDLGLVPTLRWLVKQFSRQKPEVRVDFKVLTHDINEQEIRARVPHETEISLFRICQEGLNNIAKYANPKHVRIRLECDGSRIWLTIRDDGQGFDPRKLDPKDPGDGGIGILGMQERIAALGGTLALETAEGAGTEIKVELPVRGGRRA